MELEKIKIYVPKRVAQILEKDADTFDFLKKDGVTPNKNAMLTSLIVNYFEVFKKRQEDLCNVIKGVLRENSFLGENQIGQIGSMIAGKVNREFSLDAVEKFSSLVSLKPTKESQPVIDYIETYLLDNCSLSEYFRNMFVSYTAMPQDMREKIIFKDIYEVLSEAINKRKTVFITTKGGRDNKMEIMPFGFARSKEEIHIYILYKKKNMCHSIKLSRIKSAVIVDKKATFEESEEQIFKKMLTFGPQFYYGFREEDVVVKLSKRGQLLFRKIYVHRPIPKSIEGDLYTFDCSYAQVLQYFVRFSDEVEVISPRSVKDELYDFHKRYVEKMNN